jgi:hypothetical protein
MEEIFLDISATFAESCEKSEIDVWLANVISPTIPLDSPSCCHSSMRHLVVLSSISLLLCSTCSERSLLRALGIQVPRGNGFHAFRHANATLMNSFGASQKLRQQRLGQSESRRNLVRQFGEFWTPVGP